MVINDGEKHDVAGFKLPNAKFAAVEEIYTVIINDEDTIFKEK